MKDIGECLQVLRYVFIEILKDTVLLNREGFTNKGVQQKRFLGKPLLGFKKNRVINVENEERLQKQLLKFLQLYHAHNYVSILHK